VAIHPENGDGTITRVFNEMQSHPELIRPCLRSFVDRLCPFTYARMYSPRK
jgi:hypothetical protein